MGDLWDDFPDVVLLAGALVLFALFLILYPVRMSFYGGLRVCGEVEKVYDGLRVVGVSGWVSLENGGEEPVTVRGFVLLNGSLACISDPPSFVVPPGKSVSARIACGRVTDWFLWGYNPEGFSDRRGVAVALPDAPEYSLEVLCEVSGKPAPVVAKVRVEEDGFAPVIYTGG